MKKIVTRFPPSPTGYFHIGSARTALFNYLFAKHSGGVMTLRFEDTDKERSKKEYEDDILQGLEWLGIRHEENLLRQSERIDVYRTWLRKLIDNGHAEEAEESKNHPDKKVVRFKNPNTTISFQDAVHGEVSFETAELGDFVIARNMDEPLYHLAVVVDDSEVGVTHVIRGEDHISNTQRQILILEALGFERPSYAHIPLILAPDKSKLSKRHGAISVNEYHREGYLPEALINYLALLGWNPGGEKELYTLEELIGAFSLEHVQKAGAVFDREKLRWFNREHMQKLSDADFLAEVLTRAPEWEKQVAAEIAPLVRERISVWDDIDELKDDFSFFFAEPSLDSAKIPGKGSSARAAKRHLAEVRKLLDTLPSSRDMAPEAVKGTVWAYAEREGRAAVLWPLRYALTGKEKSPDPFTIAAVIGKEKTLGRIDAAIQSLRKT